MKYLKARARHLSAYASVMIARARILNTVGGTPETSGDVTAESNAPNTPDGQKELADQIPPPERT